ncbi:MAG: 16S rRNA (cytosine(1402)-N(4))-methyltransferase RsmH [Alphaproteobacteria bacterium]|nr:16S rRNA (cytosine(1402)-N(4))-methyltransferase RsmH [Alphaproteobacteria bacterium]
MVSTSHIPVLLKEMLSALQPTVGETYVDATFGGGSYTRAILDAADCKVVAVDRDPAAAQRANQFRDQYGDRFDFVSGCFGDLDQILPVQKYNGFVFDFGVSSFQLDDPDRGFSFRFSGPLDMRMSDTGITAADVVNTFTQEDIAAILWTYGEEQKSRRIAAAIVEKRQEKLFETTLELAELVRRIVRRKDGLDPATLTFQGLRIFVNNELMEIDKALKKTPSLLAVGGKIVTVAFHALEDRLVKNWIRSGCVLTVEQASFELKPLITKVVRPSDAEMTINPRSRSAKLRVAHLVPTRFGGGIK